MVHNPAGSTSAALTLVALDAVGAAGALASTSSKKCSAAEGLDAPDGVGKGEGGSAVKMSKPSWSSRWKRRIAAVATRCKCRRQKICPTCKGTGLVGDASDKTCPTCGGSGQVLKPKTIEVNIPAGVRDGSTVRLAGLGGAGMNGTQPGDLYLRIRLRPHPVFAVRGDDLEIELPIAPWEAVLGTKVEVPTIDGKVDLTIPAGAQSGQRLRLRGQGLNKRGGDRGDEYVRLKVATPKEISDEERRLYEELKRVSKFDPRKGR